MSDATRRAVIGVWGGEEAKALILAMAHYAGRPHSRIMCPNCGRMNVDSYEIKYHLCGNPGCVEKNVRLVIVRIKA